MRDVNGLHIMGDAVDRALSENHALIAAILEHHNSGRHVPAVALLERLQMNLEFVAAIAEHGAPAAPPLLPAAQVTLPPRPVFVQPHPPRIAPALPAASSYWTKAEHARFENAMSIHASSGKDGKVNVKQIAQMVGTRTPVQVRSHLQKVQKKGRKEGEESEQTNTGAKSDGGAAA